MTRTALYFVLLFIAAPVEALFLKPPGSPPVVAFGDNKAWFVYGENMPYEIKNTGVEIIVPNGFVMDYASIPGFLWPFGLTPHNQYSRAAIIHDYLYWSQSCTKEQADNLMFISMEESNVGWLARWAVYLAVNFFGKSSWNENDRERQAGLPRILTMEEMKYQRLEEPNIHWKDYRKTLKRDEIKFEKNLPYCKYGNSKKVSG